MEYTIQKLARMAGVSTRTLRYYDEIGLLKPLRVSSSGYRIYGQQQVKRLQQILFYRELEVPLDNIKAILDDQHFDEKKALEQHRALLLQKRTRIDALIANVEHTIDALEGRRIMSDKQRFEAFKQQLIDENEKQYGKEARERYGDEAVDRSNQQLKNMTPEQYQAITALEAEFRQTLARAFQTGDPAGELAQKAVDLHRQWLTFYWGWYNKEAHAGLGQMYVEDPRFRAYYDKQQPGTAAFLRDAIQIYVNSQSE